MGSPLHDRIICKWRQCTISKFSKTKNQTQKRPPKVPKNQKTYIRRPQIKKFYKTDSTKNGNSDSKYNFKIFKNQNQTQKRPPQVPKKKKKQTQKKPPQIPKKKKKKKKKS